MKMKTNSSLWIKIAATLLLLCVAACSKNSDSVPLTVITTPTIVQENSGILIALDRGNPPFMYEKEGKAAGLYPLLIEEVFKRIGEPVTVKPYPWKRALEMGENGEAGVGGIYKNTKRLEIFDYSDPIFEERLMVYVRKGESFDFDTVNDLKGKRIGVLSGWSYGDEFDIAKEQGLFEVEEVSDDRTNFEKLLLGRLDCVIAIDLGAGPILNEQRFFGQFVTLSTPLAVNETFLVFAKSTNQKELLERFNEMLTTMRLDGSFDTLVQNFLDEHE
jgi:polar amino acid transport system substrate-binding protein